MKSVKVRKPSSSVCCSNTDDNLKLAASGGITENSPCSSEVKGNASNSPASKNQEAGNSCCSSVKNLPDYVLETIKISGRNILKVSTILKTGDKIGSLKVRLGINRMNYKVEPGIYCVGNPLETSPVLVTANYKLTFDSLRKELAGLDAFILVLDTKGINVWCAAGKGTFGTSELINRINKTELKDIVTHRNLILPQLGAPGVAAHEVRKHTGFSVTYGTVRASDLKGFLKNNMTAAPEMKKVNFNLKDRAVLIPVELNSSLKSLIIIFGVLFILNSIGFGKYGLIDLTAFLGAVITGDILVSLLLPWIPGRAFSFKGYLLGILWAVLILYISFQAGYAFSIVKAAGYSLILPTISAYLAMNFTGCSTYTSLSGVRSEMKLAVPVMVAASGIGVLLIIIDSILNII